MDLKYANQEISKPSSRKTASRTVCAFTGISLRLGLGFGAITGTAACAQLNQTGARIQANINLTNSSRDPNLCVDWLGSFAYRDPIMGINLSGQADGVSTLADHDDPNWQYADISYQTNRGGVIGGSVPLEGYVSDGEAYITYFDYNNHLGITPTMGSHVLRTIYYSLKAAAIKDQLSPNGSCGVSDNSSDNHSNSGNGNYGQPTPLLTPSYPAPSNGDFVFPDYAPSTGGYAPGFVPR